jgi:hypothetical protein
MVNSLLTRSGMMHTYLMWSRPWGFADPALMNDGVSAVGTRVSADSFSFKLYILGLDMVVRLDNRASFMEGKRYMR